MSAIVTAFLPLSIYTKVEITFADGIFSGKVDRLLKRSSVSCCATLARGDIGQVDLKCPAAARGRNEAVVREIELFNSERDRMIAACIVLQSACPNKGLVVWCTGLSSAGKTTIAKALDHQLRSHGIRSIVLDGDDMRAGLTRDLGYSREDRFENASRLSFVANTLSRHGFVVIVAAISPYRESRLAARKSARRFLEVYVNAPLAVCEARDLKGLYRRARTGLIRKFTGISDPYEPPLEPEVECRTETESVSESVRKILSRVVQLSSFHADRLDVR